jgi:hypothetical protein
MDFSNKQMMEFEAVSRLSQLIEDLPRSMAGWNWIIDEQETRNDEAQNGPPWMIHAQPTFRCVFVRTASVFSFSVDQ